MSKKWPPMTADERSSQRARKEAYERSRVPFALRLADEEWRAFWVRRLQAKTLRWMHVHRVARFEEALLESQRRRLIIARRTAPRPIPNLPNDWQRANDGRGGMAPRRYD